MAVNNQEKAITDPNEYCWETGDYLETCNCDLCFHKEECSGSGYDEDDD